MLIVSDLLAIASGKIEGTSYVLLRVPSAKTIAQSASRTLRRLKEESSIVFLYPCSRGRDRYADS
jgi:hypothetical protein